MWEVIAYCITAILVSIIVAGGINRAAYYTSAAIVALLRDHLRERDKRRRDSDDNDV
jgi:hypothetical protein